MADAWKLWLVLVLPPCLCWDSEVTLMKTVGKEPDVTPICTGITPDTFVVCTISTGRGRQEDCRLLYQQAWGFENKCDPRFTLRTEDQTVSLHLSSLTPVDSGIYICKCSRPGGYNIVHLNVTVEASHEAQRRLSPSGVATIVVLSIMLPGVVLGRFLWRRYFRGETTASGAAGCETPGSLDQDDSYEALQRPGSDVYENFSMHSDSKRTSFHSDVSPTYPEQETDGETDDNCEIYENI